MSKKGWLLALYVVFFSPLVTLADSKWKKVESKGTPPSSSALYKSAVVYTVEEQGLEAQLVGITAEPAQAQIMQLPMADGSLRNFRVWQSPVLPGELAARYPGIRTFTGVAADDRMVTAKLDYTLYGFHAIIFEGANTTMVDRQTEALPGLYAAHYKKDEQRKWQEQTICAVAGKVTGNATAQPAATLKAAYRTSNGTTLRKYSLALSCNSYYAKAATGSATPGIDQVLSKMTTTLNRVNGVLERELALTMVLVAKEDTLIWTTPTGGPNGDDPFYSINEDARSCIAMNQVVCNTRIGVSGYSIGHLFTTGAGGLSNIGIVCSANEKAESVTGQPSPVGDAFDIDYVVHEMGHEFGANHPFNNGKDGSCGNGNLNEETAYEPGSGSTIMAYAGICSPDDIQAHSDAYFHLVSLEEIHTFITGAGDVCAVKTTTNNRPVSIAPFTASYTIPYLTPFELTAPTAIDSVADTSVTYCWEQWNKGDVGEELKNTHVYGPIFRSYTPVKTPTRVFPNMDMVLADSLSNAGTEDAEGEKVPDAARYLTFKLTVRNIFNGVGCFLAPDDSVHLDVINTGSGFRVTSQDHAGGTHLANNPLNIYWDIAGTNAAPISCDSVNIYLSMDGGHTWPYNIGTFENAGSALITLPATDTIIHHARLKVKGAANVFFNVNKSDFLVSPSSAITTISVFPSPAHNTVQVYTGSSGTVQFEVFDAAGRRVTEGTANGQLDIPVSYWARGVYIIKLNDGANKRTVKKFVVE
jgi:hypothetical protein